MARNVTTARQKKQRIQVSLPADIYERFKERTDETGLSESALGSLLIHQALNQAATTTACVNNTQASA